MSISRNVKQSQANKFQRVDSLFFTDFSYFICDAINQKKSIMNNPFEEIFKRLDNIEKLIRPNVKDTSQSQSTQTNLVKIGVASQLTGYSVNYLYHLANKGTIPCIRRGRSLRFDINQLHDWMNKQYISDDKEE